jgi:hypothetical protein
MLARAPFTAPAGRVSSRAVACLPNTCRSRIELSRGISSSSTTQAPAALAAAAAAAARSSRRQHHRPSRRATMETLKTAAASNNTNTPTPKPKTVLVPVADGTEEMEAVVIVDVLRRAGCAVAVASVEPGGRLAVACSRGVVLTADAPIA